MRTPPPRFDTTDWSMVLRLRDAGADGYREALEALVEIYWRPVYAYIRHSGNEPDRAEDFTQSFFLRVLEREPFRHLEREGASFRTYLRTSVRHFLASEIRHERAARRSPATPILGLSDLEGLIGTGDPDPSVTADAAFRQQWTRQVLRAARDRMRAEWEASGRRTAFLVFDRSVRGDASQADLAAAFEVSRSQVNNYVHRGRIAFRKYLRLVVAGYVTRPEDVDAELAELGADLPP